MHGRKKRNLWLEVTPNSNPHKTLRNRARHALAEERFRRKNKAALGAKGAGVKAALTAWPEHESQRTSA